MPYEKKTKNDLKRSPNKRPSGNYFSSLLRKISGKPDMQPLDFAGQTLYNRLKLLFIILLTAFCCFSARMSTVYTLDVDNDEANYTTGVGFQYAEYMRAGNISGIIECRENNEHPPLVKLFNAAAIYITGSNDNPEAIITVCRITTVIFACLCAILLFLISPWAGIIFCLHSWQIYYSSKTWLDCVTSFFAVAAFFFLIKSDKKWNKWMMLSAIFIGAGIASKYIDGIFAAAIFIILIFYFFNKPKYILYYVGVSVLSFFILDPAIWSNPLVNLKQSVFFHQVQSGESALFIRYMERYSGSTGFFGQFVTLWGNKAFYESNLLPFGLDKIILILGISGLPLLYRRSLILFTWFIAGFLFILFYPVKYPHYTLTFIPILAISASEAMCNGASFLLSKTFRNIKLPAFITGLNLAACVTIIIAAYAVNFAYTNHNVKNNNLKAYNSYAYTLANLGRTEEAAKFFGKSAQGGGELNVAAYLNMAKIFADQKQYDRAKSELDKVFQIEPYSAEGRIIYGNILLSANKDDEALNEYLKVNVNRVVNPEVLMSLYFNLGLVYAKKNNYSTSAQMFEKVIQSFPGNAEAHYMLGIDYFRLGNINAAEKELLLAVKNGSTSSKTYHDLGIVYANQRRYEEAIAAWKKALKQDPSNTELQTYIENATRLLR